MVIMEAIARIIDSDQLPSYFGLPPEMKSEIATIVNQYGAWED
jgi:hypothetical protein